LEQRVDPKGDDDDRNERAEQRERDAFSQQLPHDAPSSGADRRADDELTLPGDALSEKQPSDVGAGDEQHERRGTLEHLEGRAKKADLRFAYRLHLDAPALVPR
jgi:hypothetical protein